MSEGQSTTNVLFSNRRVLTPQQSMQKIISYALLQDAKTRSRIQRNRLSAYIFTAFLVIPPSYYLVKGALVGCWNNLLPDMKFNRVFGPQGKPYRLLYRPEIFIRERQEALYDIEKQNIEKEKAGETPTVTSPVVLWT